MAADSNCPADIELWIEKVVKSIDHPTQFIATIKLIGCYMVRLENEGLDWYIRNHIDAKLMTLILKQRQVLRDSFNTKLNE